MKRARKSRLPESTHVLVGSAVTIALIFAIILSIGYFGQTPAPAKAPTHQPRV